MKLRYNGNEIIFNETLLFAKNDSVSIEDIEALPNFRITFRIKEEEDENWVMSTSEDGPLGIIVDVNVKQRDSMAVFAMKFPMVLATDDNSRIKLYLSHYEFGTKNFSSTHQIHVLLIKEVVNNA